VGGKRRPKPGVRVICTDKYHRDTEEFARQGFHFLYMMRLFPMADGGFWPNLAGISAAAVASVKRGIHPDGQRVYRFTCSCGLDLQRLENKLVEHLLTLLSATGATDPLAGRVDLYLTTL
jgi:hypothetical protein